VPPDPPQTPKPAEPVFRLLLRSKPSSIPATVRLRRLLKAIGRGYLFRCESVEQVGQDPAGEAE
jgi:hypothetical protein